MAVTMEGMRGLPSWCCCVLLCLAAGWMAAEAAPLPQYYNAIFSFGDSFSDTGNFVIINSGKLPNMPKFPPPYALMPETLSICRRALGRVLLTPCCWCCLDDGRLNHTGADSPPPLFTAPERLQLRIRP